MRKTEKRPKMIRTFAMCNEMRLGDDPSEIRIPYGRWPYGNKTIEMPDGSRRTVYVMQALDRAGAEKIARAVEGGVAAGGKGLPIYFGHPDVPEVAAKYPDKRAKGWARTAEAADDALVLGDIEWGESPRGGFGWFSPYWSGSTTFRDDDNVETRVEELQSIGLTNTPNILDFRLANEAGYETTTTSGGSAAQTDKDKEMREKLIAALGLPPEATDEQIFAALEKLKAKAEVAETKVEAANAETDEAKKQAEEAKADLANERKARVGLMLDNAIADGRIGPAARPAWEKRLLADPKGGGVALANEKPLKTTSQVKDLEDRRTGAGGLSRMALVNEKVGKGMTFDAAWTAAKREHPELFDTQKKQETK